MSLFQLLRVVRRRVRAAARGGRLDVELDRELTFHFEQLVDEHVAAGASPAEARRAARLAFGSMPRLADECRDARGVRWLHDVRADVVYGLRTLRGSPGFAAVAIVSLALGIGANTAVLGVMRAALQEALAIPNDDRLVVVHTFPQDEPRQETLASLDDYFGWRDANRSFDLIGVTLGNQLDFGGEGDGTPPERVQGQAATSELFALLGVRPLVGRVLTDADAGGEDAGR